MNFSILWLAFQKICFESNLLPHLESHTTVMTKKKKNRCGPGINFPFLVKMSFISNFLKYTEYKICILYYIQNMCNNILKLLSHFRKAVIKYCQLEFLKVLKFLKNLVFIIAIFKIFKTYFLIFCGNKANSMKMLEIFYFIPIAWTFFWMGFYTAELQAHLLQICTISSCMCAVWYQLNVMCKFAQFSQRENRLWLTHWMWIWFDPGIMLCLQKSLCY